jgi:hypothetical protein
MRNMEVDQPVEEVVVPSTEDISTKINELSDEDKIRIDAIVDRKLEQTKEESPAPMATDQLVETYDALPNEDKLRLTQLIERHVERNQKRAEREQERLARRSK